MKLQLVNDLKKERGPTISAEKHIRFLKKSKARLLRFEESEAVKFFF